MKKTLDSIKKLAIITGFAAAVCGAFAFLFIGAWWNTILIFCMLAVIYVMVTEKD